MAAVHKYKLFVYCLWGYLAERRTNRRVEAGQGQCVEAEHK